MLKGKRSLGPYEKTKFGTQIWHERSGIVLRVVVKCAFLTTFFQKIHYILVSTRFNSPLAISLINTKAVFWDRHLRPLPNFKLKRTSFFFSLPRFCCPYLHQKSYLHNNHQRFKTVYEAFCHEKKHQFLKQRTNVKLYASSAIRKTTDLIRNFCFRQEHTFVFICKWLWKWLSRAQTRQQH